MAQSRVRALVNAAKKTNARRAKEKLERGPNENDVLRRMLSTPPDPKKAPVKKAAKSIKAKAPR